MASSEGTRTMDVRDELLDDLLAAGVVPPDIHAHIQKDMSMTEEDIMQRPEYWEGIMPAEQRFKGVHG